MEQSVEELILTIADKSQKPPEEIRAMIETKAKKFSGLLTEEGAAYLVQKELGLKKDSLEKFTIGELADGKKGIEVSGIVESVYPVKEFEKNGKKGKLQSFILSDPTGEIRVTLWNDQVDLYKIKRHDEMTLTSVIVSSYNEKKQLTLGFGGVITVTKTGIEEKIKISEISSGMNSVTLIGRIVRKFPIKEFETNNKKGKLCSFQLGDDSAVIRTTAWNEKAEAADSFNEGDAVIISNAYTKEGRFGPELHLGYTAEIQKTTETLPSLREIAKETAIEKKINQLIDGESATIHASIQKVLSGNLAYTVCEKCGKKATKTENGLLCDTCGETKGKRNAIVSALISDDTAEIQLTAFGEHALFVIGMTQADLEKSLDEKSTESIIDTINTNQNGKEIIVYGYSRPNKFSGTNEFVAKEITN
jgi:ssDNA-binding replication factor A large subunit